MIDIIVGGQFGDEGKGSVSAWLADQKRKEGDPYRFAVRVGGSNAEHRFVLPDGRKFTSRVLPTAAWLQSHLTIIVGPGHMVRLDTLQQEINTLIELHGEEIKSKIFIDPLTGIIEPKHKEEGEKTSWRGSTHQGTGQAVAHKVLRDGTFRTAQDYPELRQYIKPTWDVLQYAMDSLKWNGILEGSQGALLSLNHGYYPYCTSKDTTPAALLTEAGIPTKYVRNIYSIYRTVPMRVPGNSGPTGGRELTWEELEEVAGIDIPNDAKIQTDSGDKERVFLWSWEDFAKSVAICGPTKMVLTFVDWFPHNLMDTNLEGLIKKMEKIAKCPVVLTRHGPKWADYAMRGGV